MDAVLTRVVDASVLIILVAIFAIIGVEKRSLLQTQMEKWSKKTTKAVDYRKTEEEIGLLPINSSSSRSPRPMSDITNEKQKTSMAYSKSTYSHVWNVCQCQKHHQEWSSGRHHSCRHPRSQSFDAGKRTKFFLILKVLIMVNAQYLMVVDYPSYGLIYRSQRYNKDRIRKVIRVLIKDEAYDRKDSIAVTNYLAKLTGLGDS